MSDLTTLPIEDDFETTLSSTWSGSIGTVNVNDTPDGTMPAGTFSYIVVNPGEANIQVAKVDGWVAGTSFNVTDIAIPKGTGVDYSAVSHAAGATVRFSNNYAFWEDIQTAINSKADTTALNAKVGDFVFTGSGVETPAPMTFSDSETAPVTLKTLAKGAPADQYVAVSENDTTVGHLDDKLNVGAGLSESIGTPGGNETLDIAVDTTDTSVFVKTSSGAGDENKVPVLNASGQIASGMIPFSSGSITPSSFTLGEDMTALDTAYMGLDGNIAKYKGIITANVSTGATSKEGVLQIDTNKFIAWGYSSATSIKVAIGTIANGLITRGAEQNVVVADLQNVATPSAIVGAKLDTGKIVLVFRNTSTTRPNSIVVTVDGSDTVAYGVQQELSASAVSILISNANGIQMGTDKVVFMYVVLGRPFMICGTCATTTMARGTEKPTDNSNNDKGRIAKLDTDKFIEISSDDGGPSFYAYVHTISGTTISGGAGDTQVNGAIASTSFEVEQLATDLVGVVYITTSGTTGNFKFISVSGTTITPGTELRLAASASSATMCRKYDTNSIICLVGTATYLIYKSGTNTANLIWTQTTGLTIGYQVNIVMVKDGFLVSIAGQGSYINNLTNTQLLGALQASGTAGQSKVVALPGQISSGHTGLLKGYTYYLQSDGTIGLGQASVGSPTIVKEYGLAISDTQLLLK